MSDAIVAVIDSSTDIAVNDMLVKYRLLCEQIERQRKYAFGLLKPHYSQQFNDSLISVQAAMYRRAREIGSFLAYVVYDSAVPMAANALLAEYIQALAEPQDYQLLHEPWKYLQHVSESC